MTKLLVWQEYREREPDGYPYSQFCARYATWARSLPITLRQTHRAGTKGFVDFSGDGLAIVDPVTGESTTAVLFVLVLGASNFTYVEPVLPTRALGGGRCSRALDRQCGEGAGWSSGSIARRLVAAR